MPRACPVATLPDPPTGSLAHAVRAAGGTVTTPDEAVGLVWLGTEPAALGAALARLPGVRWVQLPWAGVEEYLPYVDAHRQWCRARGVYGVQVAEHALMLAMVCLRDAARSVRSGRWSPRPPAVLTGQPVTIVGGGEIARALLPMLEPFGCDVTVVRRAASPLPGAAVVPYRDLDAALAAARVVVLAASLTPATRRLIDARRLGVMRSDACLVNVARGALVDTGALVRALTEGRIAAAGLDVTDPEPLPPGHPLWRAPGCFITAHCAGELSVAYPAFDRQVGANVANWIQGRPLLGVIDRTRGY
ncbi:NAD(P)-dependent oxidoreductase [Actinomadura sp. 9N215]|uniref:NAD(P)-dependent oxidoreductase n=1 Tax=Actinomadura sp. 9N215 TaxID=3375150 RepID=UPI0037A233CE